MAKAKKPTNQEKLEKSRKNQSESKIKALALKLEKADRLLLEEKEDHFITKSKSVETEKKLRAALKELKDTGDKLAKVAPKKSGKKVLPWIERASSIQLKGNMVQVSKLGYSEKYPHSYFPVGEILAGEIDDDATIEDVKEYIKSEYGPGGYMAKAFNEDAGHKVSKGKIRFKI